MKTPIGRAIAAAASAVRGIVTAAQPLLAAPPGPQRAPVPRLAPPPARDTHIIKVEVSITR